MAVINPGVTNVATTGTVNGITLTGGPITSSGTITLGGTLDLSSPPAIGGTTASTGRFTTVTSTVATGTAPFTVASTTPVTNLSIGGNAGTVTNGVYTTDTGTVTNTMLAGSIANAKLTNSSITFGSTAQALGSTVSGLSGVTIDNGAIGATTPAAGTFTTLIGTSDLIRTTGNNLFSRSQTFNGTWTTGGANVTVTDNAVTAPDSTTTAAIILPTVTSGLHRILNASGTLTVYSGVTYTASVYGKANGYRYLYFNSNTALGATSVFDLQAGTVSTTLGTASITSVGSGWYRCSVTGTATSNGAPAIYLQINNTYATGDQSFAGDGTSSIYLWGAQLEIGSSATTYVVTTSAGIWNVPTLSFASTSASSIGLQSDGSLYETSAGTGNIRFYTNNIGQEQARVTHTANAVNYQTLTGSATTYAPVHSVAGSDTNISMVLQPKNTGAIDLAAGSSGVNISNGGTVTAITRTAAGVSYTSPPSVAISAPTTAGGVQATATSTVSLQTIAVNAGGSGYLVGDVLTLVGGTGTAATITVATLSGSAVATVNITSTGAYTVIPTNPISVTGGTGTSATFTASSYALSNTINITNAGSGYVEQPTVTFSGGGGSGAVAYATVGAGTTIKSIGSSTISSVGGASFVFQTPNTAAPAFMIRDIASADSFLVANPQNAYANLLALGNTNANLGLYANGAGQVQLGTSGASNLRQMQVSHTASAVNYVQVTGAATGNNATISAQGSDASIGLSFITKGGFGMQFNNSSGGSIVQYTQSGTTSATTNYLRFTNYNGTAGNPVISTQGGDTDISLALFPKGLGIVLMNQQTPTALTATGTLTIANLLTQIITSTSAVAVALTLPTGTLSDAGVSGGTSAVNTSFDYSIINTGSAVGDVTLVAGTGHTIVGSVTVPVGTTGNFRCRKTATNTFVSYRV